MRAYGAELIWSAVSRGWKGARSGAGDAASGAGQVLDQFNNLDNPYAHFTTTGPEIWRQTEGRITHFVSSMGTTGTITGVGGYLKSQNPQVQIIGLQPAEGSSIPAFAVGRPYLPGIFRPELVDQVLDIEQRDAEQTMRQLAQREGIFCGVSSGGAVAGALRVAAAHGQRRGGDRLRSR